MKTIKTNRKIPSLRGLAPASRSPLPAPRSTAFTLLELLIAIGILAVGGAMAAALFPAAIKENQRANSSVIGKIICENGLSTVLTALDHKSSLPTSYPFPAGTLTTNSNIGVRDSAYPVPVQDQPAYPISPPEDYPDWTTSGTDVVPQTLYGFLVLGRQLINTENKYQLVIVAYKRKSTDSSINCNDIAQTVTFSSTPGEMTFSISSGAEFVQLGTPLIDKITGRFATVMSFNRSGSTGSGTLDRPIFPTGLTFPSSNSGFVIYDTDTSATRSPALRIQISIGSFLPET